MPSVLLVRYGELALKSPPVRREFERTLRRNLLDQFVAEKLPCQLRSDHGHVYVECSEPERAVHLVRRVFGVTSVSIAHDVSTDRAAIRDALIPLAEPQLRPGMRFAVRARRTGSHPFTSQELARDLGSDLFDAFPDRDLHVDLSAPEVELFVEVRGPRTYLYTTRAKGPGGLPLGVAGHVVALVDGPRGALGAYLMMKRGCRCAVVSSAAGEEFVRGTLARFDPRLWAESVGSAAPDATLASLADATRADGLVLPLAVEEYATARERWGDRVVFSPTVGFTDEEVAERWREVESLAG